MLEFARHGHEAGEKVYCDAYYLTSSCDLIDEFCAAGVRPLKDDFGFANDQLEMVNFGVDGIDRPICCLKVDLASKKKVARSFVSTVEQWAVLYCGG